MTDQLKDAFKMCKLLQKITTSPSVSEAEPGSRWERGLLVPRRTDLSEGEVKTEHLIISAESVNAAQRAQMSVMQHER